jgi:hypothetical protein
MIATFPTFLAILFFVYWRESKNKEQRTAVRNTLPIDRRYTAADTDKLYAEFMPLPIDLVDQTNITFQRKHILHRMNALKKITLQINYRSLLLSNTKFYSASSIQRGWEEFHDAPLQKNEEFVTGRGWTATELRRKVRSEH